MDALDKAVKAAGGVTSLADSLGVVQSTVSNWRKRRRVPPGHVIRIEGVTGVSRHELCPEVFGPANGQGEEEQGESTTGTVIDSRVSKRALRARLGLSSDAHLAKVLKLPVDQVASWAEEQGVPAMPQVLQLLGVQEQRAAEAAPNDPDAERVIQVQVA